MQLATGGSMLNFGYWMENTIEPISAQENLCSYFSKLAELENAKTLLMLGVDYRHQQFFGEIIMKN